MPSLPDPDLRPSGATQASADLVPAQALPASPVGGCAPEDEPLRAPPDAPRPIGPERLRELRAAFRQGRYPAVGEVVSGLERLFRPRSPAELSSPGTGERSSPV